MNMGVFKKFSGLGESAAGEADVIEKRDCLYAPYAEQGSSYLRKKDLSEPYYEFKELPEDKTTLKISKIKL